MKLTKEDLDKVRHIEGFPIGKDEDIIALSQPPYYTACPNPFIADFIKEHGKPYDEATDTYHREPFAADVSEGKYDHLYKIHSYPTKVPYKAIMKYILHYTEPGDLVFDGFCGTGMTGVAALMCGNPEYDRDFKKLVDKEIPNCRWGSRLALLNDLSPLASFISYNYNTTIEVESFEKKAKEIVQKCKDKYGWAYETIHSINDKPTLNFDNQPIKGEINYIVWSDVVICPCCSKEIVLWDVSPQKVGEKPKETFNCQYCNTELSKNDCSKAFITKYDDALSQNILIPKQIPVLINYQVNGKRFEKKPDRFDLDLTKRIDEMKLQHWYPKVPMMNIGEKWGDSWRAGYHYGVTHAHQFFTKRTLLIISYLFELSNTLDYNEKMHFMFALTSIFNRNTKMVRHMAQHKEKNVGPLSGTLYLPYIFGELNVFDVLDSKLKQINQSYSNVVFGKTNCISVKSSSKGQICENSIDYIFIDPPFGDNLMYSELNFITEAWLKVLTNNNSEAIINNAQKKDITKYQSIMVDCFSEFYRILKPNRWITIEFHNSRNIVWNSIQEALLIAGFVVADVRTLDKKKGTTKQLIYTSAVKQDLVISAYKPKESFKRNFLNQAGSHNAVWDFIRQHLAQLPRFVEHNNKIEVVAERQPYLLFDRMVAYHIVNGISVPIDAGDFYKGLKERFIERDGMYFLPDQVNEYDNKRLQMDVNKEVQLSIIVADEKSAIQWLYGELATPQTYQDLQPKFIQALHQLKYEKMPELQEILTENFLQDDTGKWYVPDVNRASDLTKLREKRLVKEFEDYLNGTGKLKVFRTEAIRAGFDQAWKKRDFATIVKIGKRLPENVIQEDPALLMYYDNALGRVEG